MTATRTSLRHESDVVAGFYRRLADALRMSVYLGPVFVWVVYYFYTFLFSGLTSHDFLKLLFSGLVAFTPLAANGLYERYADARERKRKKQEKVARQRKHADVAGLPIRTDLYVVGPRPFMHSVYRVLDELRDKAPQRYHEAIEYLPQVVFDPSIGSAGRSDGRFAVDGSGPIDRGGGWYTRNDYEEFRYIFLHEVGHNVCGKQRQDLSEDAASGYASMVTSELTA